MKKDGLSLKKQLLLWLLAPQLLLWLTGAVLSNAVAIRYANTVIDSDLLQLANTLFREVTVESFNANQDLLESTKAFLANNLDERIYYMIGRPDQPPISANIDQIPNCFQKTLIVDTPSYCFGTIAKQPVRILTILLPKPDQPHLYIEIRVAKNLIFRSNIEREILLSTVVPLSLLILITTLFVWWGINRCLAPLYHLQQVVKNRAIHDLSPIEIKNAPIEIHTLTDELNILLQTMNESIERQRRFIADAAHQLRTPLAGLKSQTELAMRESNRENLQARLQMVHTSSMRSIHLINQLLTLARSEPGRKDTISKVDMDLAKLIREITAECVPRALAAQIDLGCNTLLSNAPIKANSALLRELLLNLIENTLKYTSAGSVVTVRLLSEGNYYVIEVEDNGPGIPDIDKSRVFERFYRGTQTGEGCGLGLSIAKEIALRHNGDVEIRDAKPHGLIVKVVLPKPQGHP